MSPQSMQDLAGISLRAATLSSCSTSECSQQMTQTDRPLTQTVSLGSRPRLQLTHSSILITRWVVSDQAPGQSGDGIRGWRWSDSPQHSKHTGLPSTYLISHLSYQNVQPMHCIFLVLRLHGTGRPVVLAPLALPCIINITSLSILASHFLCRSLEL